MITWLAALTASAHVPVVYVVGPQDDWCGTIDGALGGDLILLEAGQYVGPCDIVAETSDPVGEQTSVQSLDPADPAVFVHDGSSDYVLSVSGDLLMVILVHFEGIPAGVDAIRVLGGTEMWFRYNEFRDVQGTAIAYRGALDGFYVNDNAFYDVGTAVEVGCPDDSCVSSNFEVYENLVVGAGTGVSVSQGSSGVLRDNVVSEVSGTALHLQGGGEVTVETNLLAAAGTALKVGDGPALVRSNVLSGEVAGLDAGGAAVGEVELLGNTALSASGAAFVLDGWDAGRGLRLVSNAVEGALPDVGGAEASGNVACPDPDACWTDAAALDLYPAAGSPLRDAAVADADLAHDWCGKTRRDPGAAGAFEVIGSQGYGPLPTDDFKEMFSCEDLGGTPPDDTGTTETGDTGTPSTPGTGPGATPPGDEEGSGGCGCASGGSGAVGAWAVVFALLGWWRRR